MTVAAQSARFDELLAGLPEAWAQLDADDDGEELAFGFLRAAYGAGYIDALEEAEA